MISILQIFIVLNLLSGCSEEYDNKPDDSHFLGIDSNAKDLTYGNLPINAKTIATNCDFFCYSEETGNIYYTNFDDNGHLCQLSNGTKTKLVDKKCTNINFYNNNLYFISPDVSLNELTDWEVSGPIYKFDIESKEIELFLDVNAILMRVINDNIYHSERTLQETNSSQTNKNTSSVISSFVTNIEEKRTLKNEGTMLYYKDYEVTATGLINMDTSDKTDFELSEFGLATACVYNNVLYRNFRTFDALNLKDGTHLTVNTSNLDESNEQTAKNAFSSLFSVSKTKPQILDYAVLDNKIYFCFELPVISIFERPTILSKTPDNKLLIYGYEESRGFYFTTYDPVNKTESDRIYKEYPLKFLTACDQDTYVFTSSVNPSQSITIGSLKTDGVIELPTNDFIFKKSRYKDGIFYYINQNKITKVDISSNLDFSNIKPIHIISTEYVASTSSSYGYQLDLKQLDYDEFALTVLSLDKSYDISYTYSNQDFAANLRDKGSFYPLNDIEGVKEYIDACFPALREAAINENGEIWMIPIYMQVPCVVFDKDLCRDLNINFSSNLLFKDFVSIIKTLYSDDEYKAVYHVNAQYITKIAIEQYLSENKSFNTPEFTELAQIIKDEVFRNEKAFDMSDEIRTAWMSEDRKNVAFETVNHLSEISLYEKIGRNFDIIPLPNIKGNVNYYAVCLFATVNPNSLNLSTTLAYISKVVKEMNLTDYDPNRYYAGSYNIKTAEIYSYNDFYRNLGDIMNNSKINFSMSNELFLKDFYRYLEDKITLEDFISEADRKLHAYLNE